MEWLIILAVVLAAWILGLVYMTVSVGRFAFVKKLSAGRKWLSAVLSLGLIILVFAAVSLAMSLVNAIVVFLHAVVFFLLFGLAVRIMQHVRGRRSRINWQGWLALAVTAVYLTAGYILCHHVWQTDYQLHTDKELGRLKIALIADSHIGTTFDGEGFAEHLRTIEDQSPDILLIAGDFVDDWTSRDDLLPACKALGNTDFPYGVWYVFGNHDSGYFSNRDFTATELEDMLLENGVHILADDYAQIGEHLIVAGRRDVSAGPRKSMEELLAGADTNRYIILLDHQPNDYENEADSPADLVLSGHTHGGQLLPITYVGKWFGLLDRVYGLETRRGTDFIVTSGISDWAISFKTGTKSEYVVITVDGK